MGRNLNALLNSAVRERREQSAALPSAREAADEADERETDEEERGAAAGTADLAVVRVLPAEADGAEADVPAAPGSGAEEGAGESSGRTAGAAPSSREEVPARGAEARVSRVESPTPTVDRRARMPFDPASGGRQADDDNVEAPTDGPTGDPAQEPADPPRPGDRLRTIGVERIRRGVFQPRRFFDQEALQELADSLKAQGMIQPVVVRPIGDVFELIAGERRWRAAQIAGLAEIPAIVREMEDRSVAAVSLIENIQREDLNPLEEAQALMRLCDEFGMTHASVAESIGRSRAAVSNLMRLLELHDDVKAMVDKGELDMGHARALLRVPTVDQPALAARVAKQGLTVRAVEKLIRTGVDKGASDGKATAAAPDPDIERLVERLSGVLGAPVSIRHKPGGSGRLEIRYGSLDELDGILEHIR